MQRIKHAPDHTLHWLGDSSLLISFGNTINEDLHKKVMTSFHALQEKPLKGQIDLVPAYNSLTIIFNLAIVKKALPFIGSIFDHLNSDVEERLSEIIAGKLFLGRKLEVPVCYDHSLAPDLSLVASKNNLSIAEVVQIHSSKVYKVYMLGFLPGFAYMASVDEKIATARKQMPSANVPAGSVGIAGIQTGIYPVSSPGGWQIIGQTPLTLFNAANNEPTLFLPGDEVQFIPISLQTFNEMKEA